MNIQIDRGGISVNLKRFLAMGAVLLLLTAACGAALTPAASPTASASSIPARPTATPVPEPRYQPAAWGENGACYYIYVPGEVDNLKILHKCVGPAKQAPDVWLARYFAFYATIWYDDAVLPKTSARGNYVDYIHNRYGTNTQFLALVKAERHNARYRDTKAGRDVTADTAGISADGLTMAGTQ